MCGEGRDRCALGSVKTDIGHTEPVSIMNTPLARAAAAVGTLLPFRPPKNRP